MRIQAPGFRLGASHAVAFSPSGSLLGQVGRRVAVYSVRSRKMTARSDWHFAHPAAIAFDVNNDWFAVRSTTGAIAVASCEDGHPRDRLPPLSENADDSPLLTAPDDHLVEACSSGTLRVRRLTGLAVEYVEQHPDFMLGAIDTTPDRSIWALAINRKQGNAPTPPPCRLELRSWPFASTNRRVIRDDLGHVQGVALRPSGNAIAVLHQSPVKQGHTITLLSATSGETLREASNREWTSDRGFAWSPDAAHLVVGDSAGHALLSGELEHLGHLPGDHPSDAAFSPDGALLALGYWGHGLVLPTTQLRAWFTASRAAV